MASMAAVGCAFMEAKNPFPARFRNGRLKPVAGLLVMGSDRSPRRVEVINGRKVNVIPAEDAEASGLGKKGFKGVDMPLHSCLLGRFVEQIFVYRQTFIIKYYEIEPDKTATMKTLMNLCMLSFVILPS